MVLDYQRAMMESEWTDQGTSKIKIIARSERSSIEKRVSMARKIESRRA